MNVQPYTKELLKKRSVLLSIVIGVVIILVWTLAFFLPQGKQLSKYNTQAAKLQGTQAVLETRLAQLKATSAATPKLLLLKAKYAALVPPTPDVFNYFTLISNTAKASHVTLVSITPGVGGTLIPGTNLYGIGFTLNTTGSYDDTLYFIKAIYNLPRLTVINSMSLSGGGAKTTRSAPLTEAFSLTIFSTGKPTVASAG
jgi:Tfp pilus assembly protein PilO